MNATTAPDGQAETLLAETFDSFYARCYPGMLRLVYAVTGPGSHLEELVQDSFASVYLPYLRGDLREPDFYIKRTVINRCRRWQGSQARRREFEVVTDIGGVLEPSSGEPLYEDTVANRDRLWAAMQRLSFHQRAAITLHFYDDLSYDDIAETLREPDGAPLNLVTVRSWVNRGLARLHKEMTDEHPI